jgi:hypothetical protein
MAGTLPQPASHAQTGIRICDPAGRLEDKVSKKTCGIFVESKMELGRSFTTEINWQKCAEVYAQV